jgi:hypothetical protein
MAGLGTIGGPEAALSTNIVDEHFFDTIGILCGGSRFLSHETTAQAPVAVISEATARRLWPGRPRPLSAN